MEKKILLLLNKSDLLHETRKFTASGNSSLPGSGDTLSKSREYGPGEISASGTGPMPGHGEVDHVMEISAKTGAGLEELKSVLVSIIEKGKPGEHDIVVTNMRHYQSLTKAREAVLRAAAGLQHHITGDLLAMDIRDVLYYLGEITGEITTDEILGNIFKNFCIGK
jgi:tRNA U34 5-carboxymethylaminomethyl modifying GTPase MnmE/TrmE